MVNTGATAHTVIANKQQKLGKGRRGSVQAGFDQAAAEFIENTGRPLYTEFEKSEMSAAKNRKLAAALTERRQQADERRWREDHGLPSQNLVKDFYDRKAIQIFVAGLIVLNFFISAVEAQMFPKDPIPGIDDAAILTFMIMEYFFAYVFLIELLVNFYGNYFWQFWKSSWNIFDFLIVVISLLALYMNDLPGISVLRLFRAFRVVRLFKRIKTMRVMMDSILRSLPGMSIAFIALFLIMGIYGIIGVNFWAEDFPLFFGDFLKAVLSLLQIMTFDSWSSGIARPVILDPKAGGAVAAIYFITYVFIASIIMANVLIALLLEEFMGTAAEADAEEAEEDGEDPHEALDKMMESNHAKLEEKFMGDARHSGLVNLSALLEESNVQRDNDSESGGHAGVEMTKLEKNNYAATSGRAPSSTEPVSVGGIMNADFQRGQSADPVWRSQVDENIVKLTRSLENVHQKLDKLLREDNRDVAKSPDYLRAT